MCRSLHFYLAFVRILCVFRRYNGFWPIYAAAIWLFELSVISDGTGTFHDRWRVQRSRRDRTSPIRDHSADTSGVPKLTSADLRSARDVRIRTFGPYPPVADESKGDLHGVE